MIDSQNNTTYSLDYRAIFYIVRLKKTHLKESALFKFLRSSSGLVGTAWSSYTLMEIS